MSTAEVNTIKRLDTTNPSVIIDDPLNVIGAIKRHGVDIASSEFSVAAFFVESGSADAYVLTTQSGATPPTSYTLGMIVRCEIGNTSTGASTLSLNGLVAKTIEDVGAGTLLAGQIYAFRYDGTNFAIVPELNGVITGSSTVPAGILSGTLKGLFIDEKGEIHAAGTTGNIFPINIYDSNGLVFQLGINGLNSRIVNQVGDTEFRGAGNSINMAISKNGVIDGLATVPSEILNATVNGYALVDGAFWVSTDATSNQNIMKFVNPNGQVGSIQTSGSATSFNTSSDPRLKSAFTVPTDDELEAAIEGLAACSGEFHFLNDGDQKKVWGFNAHAVEDLVFGSEIASPGEGPRGSALGDVYGTHTEEYEDNNGDTQTRTVDDLVTPSGVDQSKAVPGLVMVCKMLLDRVKALEAL